MTGGGWEAESYRGESLAWKSGLYLSLEDDDEQSSEL